MLLFEASFSQIQSLQLLKLVFFFEANSGDVEAFWVDVFRFFLGLNLRVL